MMMKGVRLPAMQCFEILPFSGSHFDWAEIAGAIGSVVEMLHVVCLWWATETRGILTVRPWACHRNVESSRIFNNDFSLTSY